MSLEDVRKCSTNPLIAYYEQKAKHERWLNGGLLYRLQRIANAMLTEFAEKFYIIYKKLLKLIFCFLSVFIDLILIPFYMIYLPFAVAIRYNRHLEDTKLNLQLAIDAETVLIERGVIETQKAARNEVK